MLERMRIKWNLLHCRWECILVQPLWRTVWRFLTKTSNQSTIWPSKEIKKWPEHTESKSHSIVSDSLQLHRLYSSWTFPGQNTGVDSHSLFQDIFPTQGSNPGLPHCRQILYQLSHKGSPEYREELDNKGFNHSDNQNGVVIHLE